MNTSANDIITVVTEVNASIEKVWALWTTPEDIMQWNNTSTDWHCPWVDNDLRTGGKFLFRMGLKDGSLNFDFTGTYTQVKTNELISYVLDDGRTSTITFTGDKPVIITEAFEKDKDLPADMQRNYCKGVLNSFKQYTESKA